VDVAVGKRFYLREGHYLEFRGEFYNMPNVVKMGGPVVNFASAAFGTVTTATDARQIQLALRYSF
jgi:hypothetical protein